MTETGAVDSRGEAIPGRSPRSAADETVRALLDEGLPHAEIAVRLGISMVDAEAQIARIASRRSSWMRSSSVAIGGGGGALITLPSVR